MATKLQETISATRPGYNLIEKVENCISLPYPPLAIMFANKLTGDEVTAITSLGASIVPGRSDGDTMYSFGSDSINKALLTYLLKHKKKSKLTNPHPMGATNLAGLQALHKAMAIITWFLKTQYYPAFHGPVADAEEGLSTFDTLEGFITSKRKGTFALRYGKRLRLEGEDETMAEEDETMGGVGDDQGLEAIEVGSGSSSVPKAKPSPIPAQIVGDPTSIPTLPGLCFPYFPNMIEPDTNFVASIVAHWFLECLGDTREEIISGHKALKGGIGSFARTASGMILQHIFAGIKLAIEAQARLYLLVSDGRYTGFTLHGWYFTVVIDGYKHRPVVFEELLKKVQLIDEHAVAVARIMERLSRLRLKDSNKKPTKAWLQGERAKLSNARGIADLVRKFDLEEDDGTEIEKLSNKLAFPQRFWDLSVENILKAIDLLVSKSFPPPDAPMFTRGGVVTTSSPLLSTFACFGESAFSFRVAGGVQTKIPVDRASDTLFKQYRGKNDKVVIPSPVIIVGRKSLGLCVEDWVHFESDHLFLMKKSRDSPFRNVTFGGPKAKELWFGLIDRVGAIEIDSGKAVHADEVELGEDVVDDHAESFLDFL